MPLCVGLDIITAPILQEGTVHMTLAALLALDSPEGTKMGFGLNSPPTFPQARRTDTLHDEAFPVLCQRVV